MADLVIAFWDGSSRGTRYTIDYAKRMGVKTIVYVPKPRRARPDKNPAAIALISLVSYGTALKIVFAWVSMVKQKRCRPSGWGWSANATR